MGTAMRNGRAEAIVSRVAVMELLVIEMLSDFVEASLRRPVRATPHVGLGGLSTSTS
jgi:hypothetical protein